MNGQSQGRQTKGPSGSPQTRYRLMWNDVKYAPGTLKVVAYDAQGQPAATEEVRTADKPDHLRLLAESPALAADGQDLAFVTVRVEDAQGNLCPDAAPELSFQVSEAGRFRAVANGDSTNLQPFQQPRMRAFQGQLVAIVQAGTTAGPLRLQATGKGLRGATLEVLEVKVGGTQ